MDTLARLFVDQEGSSLTFFLDGGHVFVRGGESDSVYEFVNSPEEIISRIKSLEEDGQTALGPMEPGRAGFALFQIHTEEAIYTVDAKLFKLELDPSGVRAY